MMGLCKKSVHSFLGFSNFKDNLSPDFSRQNHPPVGGLIFFTVSGEVDRPVNVVESAAVKKPPPPLPPTTTTGATAKGHMGVVGLKDSPIPTTTITTVVTEHMGGQDFLKSPPPTTTTATTNVVSTTTKSDPDGKDNKEPPPPPRPPPTPTTTATGHMCGLGFPEPPLPTTTSTTSVVATTTKSDPDGKEHKNPPPPPTTATTDFLASTTKRDPGSIGFLDEVGGSVDGLMSCTESLGFESSDERRVDSQILDINLPSLSSKPKKTIPVKKEVKKFPPPLSSLTDNGQPKFFLRPVRKDGRLELTEVKIQLPEIFHASRQDGRLRLQFVCDRDEEAVNQETLQENPKEFQEKIQEQRESEKLEEEQEEWKIPAMNGGGDGFRRCHKLVSSHQRGHQHHHNHIWSQRCVTIG